MPLTIEAVTIPFSEVARVATLESDLEEKNAALLLKEKEIFDLNGTIGRHADTIINLQRQIETRPIVGIPRKPTIDKITMKDVAGVAIPKGNAPSAAQDQNSRDMMLLWSMMGGNAWRGFFNLQEIKAHVAMLDNNINHLPGYGRRLGLTFIADTLNNLAVNLSDSDLKIALDGLRKMSGTDKFIGFFDDANQYREARNADGTLKYPAGTLERLVGRIRSIAPDMILIASLTANATINDYKPLFDFVEAQTFGPITDLPKFLVRSFDVYCLDGRKEISVDYLTKSVEIIAQNNPKNLFWYVTGINDWKGMGEKIPLIKQIVSRWWTQPR
jgi:hypothetical protein